MTNHVTVSAFIEKGTNVSHNGPGVYANAYRPTVTVSIAIGEVSLFFDDDTETIDSLIRHAMLARMEMEDALATRATEATEGAPVTE